VPELVGGGGVGPRQGKEPVQVGMLEPSRKAAGAATTTRLLAPLFAEQQLSEPEAEPFFPDPGRAVDQDGLRQRTRPRGAGEQAAHFRVPTHRKQRHHRPPRCAMGAARDGLAAAPNLTGAFRPARPAARPATSPARYSEPVVPPLILIA